MINWVLKLFFKSNAYLKAVRDMSFTVTENTKEGIESSSHKITIYLNEIDKNGEIYRFYETVGAAFWYSRVIKQAFRQTQEYLDLELWKKPGILSDWTKGILQLKLSR